MALIQTDIEVAGGARILIWEVTESVEELQALLQNFSTYQMEFSLIKTDKRKKEFLVTRILANQMVSTPLRIIYNSDKKPEIENSLSKISFTHSGRWVAAVYHDVLAVGIDLECPSEKIDRVVPKFTHPFERERFTLPENRNEFLLIWCAKETIYKITGKEVTDFSKTMQVLPFIAGEKGVFLLQILSSATQFPIYYCMTSNFALTWSLKE